MTVKDLIYILQQYDQNLPVMVQGYEGGLVLLTPELVEESHSVGLNYHEGHGWVYGPHEEEAGDTSAIIFHRS